MIVALNTASAFADTKMSGTLNEAPVKSGTWYPVFLELVKSNYQTKEQKNPPS
jgi:hypothetical protein